MARNLCFGTADIARCRACQGSVGQVPQGWGRVKAAVHSGFWGAGSQQQRAGDALLPKALHCVRAAMQEHTLAAAI